MKQFEYSTDPNHRPNRKENIVFLIIAIICSAFFIGYVFKEYLDNGDLVWLLECVISICVIFILVFIVARKDDLLLSREIMINENGLKIKPLDPDHYSWKEIKTVSFEDVRDTFFEYSYSDTHYGRVLILSPEKLLRKRSWHPAAVNNNRLNMVSIFFDGKQDPRPHFQFSFRNGRYGPPYFEFFSGDEQEWRQAMNEWGVEPTYDYMHDYFGDWNSRTLAKCYDLLIMTRVRVNEFDAFLVVSDKDEVIGILLVEDGWNEETVLRDLEGRTEIRRIMINYELDREKQDAIMEILPMTEIIYSKECIIHQLLFYGSVEKEERIRKAVGKLIKCTLRHQYDDEFAKAINSFSDDIQTINRFNAVKEKIYSVSVNKPDLRFAEKTAKAANMAMVREQRNDEFYRSRIAYSVLKKEKNADKELLWKFGQQGYHW
jgi:hypothetical protein